MGLAAMMVMGFFKPRDPEVYPPFEVPPADPFAENDERSEDADG